MISCKDMQVHSLCSAGFVEMLSNRASVKPGVALVVSADHSLSP